MTKNLVCPNYSHCPVHQIYPSTTMDVINDNEERYNFSRYQCTLLEEFKVSLYKQRKASEHIQNKQLRSQDGECASIECALIEEMNNSYKILNLLREK